ARRFSRRARDERGRSARRILRPLVLRGLFHRPRRHEARGHGVQAAAEETAASEEKEIALTRSGCAAPCKDQAGNREPSSAPLFYTRRLVLRPGKSTHPAVGFVSPKCTPSPALMLRSRAASRAQA